MADLMNAFESKFLKASDVGDDMVPGTIVRVEQQQIGDEKANVAYFAEDLGGDGKNKPMRLNVGNSRMVAKLAGTGKVEEIRNIPVLLFAVETQNKDGSPCMGLRLRKGAALGPEAQEAADVVNAEFGGSGTEGSEAPF